MCLLQAKDLIAKQLTRRFYYILRQCIAPRQTVMSYMRYRNVKHQSKLLEHRNGMLEAIPVAYYWHIVRAQVLNQAAIVELRNSTPFSSTEFHTPLNLCVIWFHIFLFS